MDQNLRYYINYIFRRKFMKEGAAVFDPDRIEDLQFSTEKQIMDRKSARIKAVDLAIPIVAMANADGGYLAIGIEDDGTITGIDNYERNVNELLRVPYDYCIPSVQVDLKTIDVTNNNGNPDHVLRIQVFPNNKVVSNQADDVFLRVGDKSKRLNFEQRLQLVYAKGVKYFEDQPVANATINDLDLDFISEYCKKIGYTKGDAKHYLRHNHDFVTLHGDNEVVSGAAILLFGTNPQRFFPRARIRFVRYEGKTAEVGDRMNVVKDVKFTGRILDQLPGLVRVSNIREFHFSRNPKIVELLNEYDLVKEFGEGVDRIYRDMEEAGLPEPVYRQSEFMLYATLKNKNWRKEEASWGEITYGASYDEDKLLEFCTIPRTRKELMDYMGLVNRKTFTKRFLSPLLKAGKLVMTIPDKPTSSNQKYVKR